MKTLLIKSISYILLFSLLSFCSSNDNTISNKLIITNENLIEQDTQSSVFITSLILSNLSLNINDIAKVSVTVKTKPGLLSSDVKATYVSSNLVKENKIVIPIFGLYSNYENDVNVEFFFKDNSSTLIQKKILTGIYEDPYKVEENLTISKSPQLNQLPFSYFVLKNQSARNNRDYWSVIVMDIDGNVRWVRSKPTEDETIVNPISRGVTFHNNKFIQFSEPKLNGSEPSIIHLNLDGTYKSYPISGSNYILNQNYFTHHDIKFGKNGYLMDINAESEEQGYLEEQIVAEISSEGQVLKEFDFGKIISDLMTASSDDPTSFVIPGQDWFHSNSVLYDSSDDSLLVSSRENFIIKIGFEDQKIKWVFGDNNKKWYVNYPSLRNISIITNASYPMGQHGLEKIDDYTYLFFNNGTESYLPANSPAGLNLPTSLVQIFKFDEANLTAEELWSYDANYSSPICSNAQKFSGDSLEDVYLINYSSVDWVRGSNSGPTSVTRNILQAINSDKTLLFEMSIPSSNCDISWHSEIINFENLLFLE